MSRAKSDSKNEGDGTATSSRPEQTEQRRGQSGRATPKRARDDALARQRARERAARDD
jgi:hypothetical protein